MYTRVTSGRKSPVASVPSSSRLPVSSRGEPGQVDTCPRIPFDFSRISVLEPKKVSRRGELDGFVGQEGIARESAVKRFTKGGAKVHGQWDKLNAQQRCDKIGKLVNEELSKADSYKCNVQLMSGSKDLGQFDFPTWSLQVGEAAIDADTISDEKMADLLDTFLHEARHSEQWFQMARVLAGRGKKADEIARHMGIPLEVAKAAMSKPMKRPAPPKPNKSMSAKDKKKSDQMDKAEAWYNSVYGTKRTDRSTVYKAMDLEEQNRAAARTALQLAVSASSIKKAALETAKGKSKKAKAQTEYNEAETEVMKKTKALDEATAKYRASIRAYKALPEEADAFALGGRVQKSFLAVKNK